MSHVYKFIQRLTPEQRERRWAYYGQSSKENYERYLWHIENPSLTYNEVRVFKKSKTKSREKVKIKLSNKNYNEFSLEEYLVAVRQDTGRSRAREMVRLRDKHTCQDCGFKLKTVDVLMHNMKKKTLKGKLKSLDVHHINGMCGKNSLGYDSPKDISGMITLCHKCHFNRPEHKTKSKAFQSNAIKASNLTKVQSPSVVF